MKFVCGGDMTIHKMVAGTVLVLALMMPVAGIAGEDTLFTKLDTDKNGSISKDELLKSSLVVVKGPKGKMKVVHRDMVEDGSAVAMTEDQKTRLFDQLDTDKNGQISKKEWKRASRNGLILLTF